MAERGLLQHWYSEVDPAIRRHGEPHIVRVGVGSKLTPGMEHIIFVISGTSYITTVPTVGWLG